MPRVVVAAALGMLVLAGLASAATQDTFALKATLGARAEVPKPTGVPATAAGTFTATAVELQNARARLSWRLTFTKLTGRAAAAHIHIGKAGKAGGVMAGLCGPCRSGQRGTVTITQRQLRTIRAGGAYVNVHTARNAAGELRGQLKATKTGTSSGGAPPPPDPGPVPEPPPYP
jgi:hypothetical protein